MVLQFSLVALLPDYGTNKQSNIVESSIGCYQSCQLERTKQWIALVARAYHS